LGEQHLPYPVVPFQGFNSRLKTFNNNLFQELQRAIAAIMKAISFTILLKKRHKKS
jgi:hypothetical protein